MATTVKTGEVIKNIIQVKDVSLKALDKQHIPTYLWNELQKAKKDVPPPPKKVETPKEVVETPKEETPKEVIPELTEYEKYVLYNLKYGVLDYSDWERQYPSYWEEQIEKLERRRSVYNRKRGWSAKDENEVNSIDRKLDYCHKRLDELKVNTDSEQFSEFGDEYEEDNEESNENWELESI